MRGATRNSGVSTSESALWSGVMQGCQLPEYAAWNAALAEYVVRGLPRRAPVYLSVDDEVIQQVGKSIGVPTRNEVTDFLQAVRRRCASSADGGCVRLDRLTTVERSEALQCDIPGCVAFLGVTVLAATRMGDDKAIDESSYFPRLRQLLGIPSVGAPARPTGLRPPGEEEELWKRWNAWLVRRGLTPTARCGPKGKWKYITLPINQAILRGTDRTKLWFMFSQNRWTDAASQETLSRRLTQPGVSLTAHLTRLLKDPERRQTAMDAIYDLYDEWREDGSRHGAPSRLHRPGDRIRVGLGRKDTLWEVRYFFLSSPSIEEHVTAPLLDKGCNFPPSAGTSAQRLSLPRRDLWVLVPDPDNPDGAVLGTFGRPHAGEPFALLCKRDLLFSLRRLRERHLLEWEGAPNGDEPAPGVGGSWIEFHGCLVKPGKWADVPNVDNAVLDALRPEPGLSLSFGGGVRAPELKGWLHGHPPQFTLSPRDGMSPGQSQVTLFQVTGDAQQTVWTEQSRWHEPHTLGHLEPGTYVLSATVGQDTISRHLEIARWEDLAPGELHEELGPLLGQVRVRGALLHELMPGAIDQQQLAALVAKAVESPPPSAPVPHNPHDLHNPGRLVRETKLPLQLTGRQTAHGGTSDLHVTQRPESKSSVVPLFPRIVVGTLEEAILADLREHGTSTVKDITARVAREPRFAKLEKSNVSSLLRHYRNKYPALLEQVDAAGTTWRLTTRLQDLLSGKSVVL